MTRWNPNAYGRLPLRELVGDMSQLAAARPVRLTDGADDGVSAVDFHNSSGLEFTVLPSRGLDISAARFCGMSLAWRSPMGERHPAYFEPTGLGWLRTFPGGLLTTCGYTYMGPPVRDGEAELGLHGRASTLPAASVHCSAGWVGDEYIVSVSGKVREAVLFGDCVEMERRIWCRLGEPAIHIEDKVTNIGFQPAPLMLLYHMNYGFPVVQPGSRLELPAGTVQPRDAEAADGFDRWSVFEEPTPGFREKVYYHRPEPDADGMVEARLVNPQGIGVAISYPQAALPCLTEWKQMGQGTYTVGVEPGTAFVSGRPAERAAGRVPMLAPCESRSFSLTVRVLEG
ncbi:MAG: aldose 1-epimerase family protein [Armatimonadetes bacterium]|nr:aldose 1-epimerase family protein [Armatimonadota bacterium]